MNLTFHREGERRIYEIAICDDDSDFASGFGALLSEILQERGVSFRVCLYTHPAQVLAALRDGKCCDLIFQDILLGEENGVHFIKSLREKKWDAEVVFVTTSSEYVMESLAAFPLTYLLKPVSREQLEPVLDRFLAHHVPRSLRLTTPQGMIRMTLADIVYFEIYDHNIVIHLQDGSVKHWRGTLKELENLLPPNSFVRPHRSYLVNLEHIVELESTRLHLSSGTQVPISRYFFPQVQMSMIGFDTQNHIAD